VLSDVIPTPPATPVQPSVRAPYDPGLLGAGSMVPYAAAWTSEHTLPGEVMSVRSGGIGYADERPTDRDQHGVLWARMSSNPGQGRPLFTKLHPLRQRRAMWRLLCQVCGKPADETDQGHLWLLTNRDQAGALEGMASQFPPVCLACARWSVRLCPPLRRGHVAIRARSKVDGVIGVMIHPARGMLPDTDEVIAYTDPVIRWVLATHLIRTLHDCTLVDLDEVAE
jgi:hypothetical protein